MIRKCTECGKKVYVRTDGTYYIHRNPEGEDCPMGGQPIPKTYGHRATGEETCPACHRTVRTHLPSNRLYRHYAAGEKCWMSGFRNNTIGTTAGEFYGVTSSYPNRIIDWTAQKVSGGTSSTGPHLQFHVEDGPELSLAPGEKDPRDVVSSPQVTESKENVVSIERLRQDVRQAPDFPVGSVIRWTVNVWQKNKDYTFAAIKTSVGWQVTGTAGWKLAGRMVPYQELVLHLGDPDVKDVALATEWAGL